MSTMPKGCPPPLPSSTGAAAIIMTPWLVRSSPLAGLPSAKFLRQGKSAGNALRAARSRSSGSPVSRAPGARQDIAAVQIDDEHGIDFELLHRDGRDIGASRRRHSAIARTDTHPPNCPSRRPSTPGSRASCRARSRCASSKCPRPPARAGQNSASAPASALRSRARSARQTAAPAARSFWCGYSSVPSYQNSRYAAVPLSYFASLQALRRRAKSRIETRITMPRAARTPLPSLTLLNRHSRTASPRVTSHKSRTFRSWHEPTNHGMKRSTYVKFFTQSSDLRRHARFAGRPCRHRIGGNHLAEESPAPHRR